MISKINIHNKNNNLTFDSKNHKYFVNGIEHESVTNFLKKYFPFKRDEVARKIAEKRWVTEDEILDEWDEARNFGSVIHDLIDKYLKNNNLTKEELAKISSALDFLNENEFEVLGSEIKVFSKKHGLAGTIDLLVKDSTGKVFIIDWKTNKKPIDKKEVFEMAKKPFDDFPNNKFYLYSMQLSAYSLILKEEYEIDVYDCFLVQLSDSFNVVDVLNLKPDLLELFE